MGAETPALHSISLAFSHATTFQILMDKEKQKRTRRSAPKSRGGCLTCKNRRVKCDETRPLCNRCAKAGRTCEGYPQDTEDQPTLINDPARTEFIVQLPARKSASPPTADDFFTNSLPIRLHSTTSQELRFLEFFYHRTAPHISGFFDGDFYGRFLLQAGQYEPSIRYAMMACGAMHEHYEFQVVPTIERRPGFVKVSERPPLALASYNKAISALMKQLSSGSGTVEAVAMCCLLFVCLECLRGDPQSAAAHLRSGGSILASWKSRHKLLTGPEVMTKDQPTTKDPRFVENLLIPIFQRIGAQVTAAGRLSSAEFNRLGREDLASHFQYLNYFEDLETARNALISIGDISIRVTKTASEQKYMAPPTAKDIQTVESIRQRLADWKTSMDRLAETMPDSLKYSRRVSVLYIHQRCYNVALAAATRLDQRVFDEYNEDFDWIISRCEELINPVSNLSDRHLEIFNLEEGCVPDCYYTATHCRDPVIRRRALKILQAGPARQGIWNARLFAKVVQRIIHLEEQQCLPPQTLSHPDMDTPPIEPSLFDASFSLPPTPESLPAELADLAIPLKGSTEIPYTASAPNIISGIPVGNNVCSPFDYVDISEEARIHLADIHETPGASRQHSVTFFSKPNGLQADWRVWTEDLYL